MVCSHAVSPFLGLCLHMHVNTYDPCLHNLLVQSGGCMPLLCNPRLMCIFGVCVMQSQDCANSQFVWNIRNTCQLKRQHTAKHLI